MKKKFTNIIPLLLIVIAGCVTDFNMEIEDAEPRLVVDGLITDNPGPYLVRLVKSNPAVFNTQEMSESFPDGIEPVLNAELIISDDYGQIDTLIPAISYDNHFLTSEMGFYQTNTIEGIPGHTYQLKIKVDGKEYSAECYMPDVPEIDSLDYVFKKGEIGKFDEYVPRLYFKEPQQEKNYYIVSYRTHMGAYEENPNLDFSNYNSALWQKFIFNDEYLDSYVKGLRVENGSGARDLGYYWIMPGMDVSVRMMSLTKETFNFYEVLLEQFEYDGGTYKPAPASPPTNISNGGLGFFRASAVSQASIKMPDYGTH